MVGAPGSPDRPPSVLRKPPGERGLDPRILARPSLCLFTKRFRDFGKPVWTLQTHEALKPGPCPVWAAGGAAVAQTPEPGHHQARGLLSPALPLLPALPWGPPACQCGVSMKTLVADVCFWWRSGVGRGGGAG